LDDISHKEAQKEQNEKSGPRPPRLARRCTNRPFFQDV
jgi:hypothetical protein